MIVIGVGNDKKPFAAKAWKTINMLPKNKPISRVTQDVSGDKNITIAGDADGVFISGKNNKVSQTITQIINIFRGDGETLDQHNRRILLNHVENFWVKGVLEKSLYGEVLIELGMKEEPGAVKTYPWGIKRENTGETLPAGMTMLEIFEQIGLGRSLLILGAPGSGKTTMLLELARQLIARARQDVSEPIPMVFNLASWTEKQTLSQWLVEQLNLMYYVPKKTAPDWVNGNKLLLLLDGLDEVRADNRVKCVETINIFRKEHGLTNLAVCSRNQDYTDLKTNLSFDGVVAIQPLTASQVQEYFQQLGVPLIQIRQALKTDAALNELAESPLFLSIITLAYRNASNIDIPQVENIAMQRKYFFNLYIARMFERRPEQSQKVKKQDMLRWLSWLAYMMSEHNQIPYSFEHMQPGWLGKTKQLIIYRLLNWLVVGLIVGFFFGLAGWLISGFFGSIELKILGTIVTGQLLQVSDLYPWSWRTAQAGLFDGLLWGMAFGLLVGVIGWIRRKDIFIKTVDSLSWNWIEMGKKLRLSLLPTLILWLSCAVPFELALGIVFWKTGVTGTLQEWVLAWVINFLFLGAYGLALGTSIGLILGLYGGLGVKQMEAVTRPGQRLFFSSLNALFAFLLFGLLGGLILELWVGYMHETILYPETIPVVRMICVAIGYLIVGSIFALLYGGLAVIQHYCLRLVININNFLPWKLTSFLDYCCDLIFLRRVGGGYIFIHRLLMEHFAEMYNETNKAE